MPEYQNYSVDQFATDPAFRSWVLDPDTGSDAFWQRWLLLNKEKTGTVNQAKTLVLAVHEKYRDELQDAQIQYEISELVQIAKERHHIKGKRNALFFSHPFWRIAAMIVVSAGLFWGYDQFSYGKKTIASSKQKSTLGRMQVKVNNSELEMTVLLSDNSVATLMKGSRLTYPTQFTGDERKVFLSGEAFFDIAKDPQKPFLVFANETVTKVLGTSFRVKAFDNESTVMVVVKTGRVSVYPRKEYETLADPNDREVAGVILSPNQQVVFKKKENRLEKGIVANPGMLKVSSDQKELIFDDKPVSEVLHTLENIYGIVIVFDAESLSSCLISTQFNEENLKQRMSVICQAIGATYEMVDGQIIVNSKGCSS
jgi:ferric-dicitrate binding protein FerR (iron transport regulator)